MLGLIIVHDEAGVNDAGNPPEQRQQKAKDETHDAASHEDGDRREDDAKKVAERFHRNVPQARTFARSTTRGNRGLSPPFAHSGIDPLQGRSGLRITRGLQLILRIYPLRWIGLGLSRRLSGFGSGTTGQGQTAQGESCK
jgi:hypothetical protein